MSTKKRHSGWAGSLGSINTPDRRQKADRFECCRGIVCCELQSRQKEEKPNRSKEMFQKKMLLELAEMCGKLFIGKQTHSNHNEIQMCFPAEIQLRERKKSRGSTDQQKQEQEQQDISTCHFCGTEVTRSNDSRAWSGMCACQMVSDVCWWLEKIQ